ncbi:hypothetical protein EYF80_021047 [Liparis tanakae]|uniref:Uncharacterized protein n=1 Tax=Liparis tanakae TaxID=230148 RepID=A0A4Z2HTT7_9TELE|nr:hypothetical protein EYF80_021047 [Liparis tanakae]
MVAMKQTERRKRERSPPSPSFLLNYKFLSRIFLRSSLSRPTCLMERAAAIFPQGDLSLSRHYQLHTHERLNSAEVHASLPPPRYPYTSLFLALNLNFCLCFLQAYIDSFCSSIGDYV